MENATSGVDRRASDRAVLVGVGVGYLLAGYLAFHLCVRRARRLGVMGHY